MRSSVGLGGLIGLILFFAAAPNWAAISGLQLVASGLTNPIYVTHAPGDQDRLFIVQRRGEIRILNLNTGVVEATPFLSIPNVDLEGEGGLLGMAFHPDYANNGQFYVNVTTDNGGLPFQGAVSLYSTRIRQYTVSDNPNVANPTPIPVLSIVQPGDNHKGGWIGFNPALTPDQRQYLHIPTGDGGGMYDLDDFGRDPGHTPGIGNSQDITDNLLGKIVRIDVNGDDFPADTNRNYKIIDTNPYADVRTRDVTSVVTGDDEIWALGLRNPFRDSFDRLTGDLWIGDVGQHHFEEIDRQPANAPGAENLGWRLREGDTQTPTAVGGSIPPNYRAPVYDYAHPTSNPADPINQLRGRIVTGGYVYRGPDPSSQGKYFFLDSGNTPGISDDNCWTFNPADPVGTVSNIDSQLTPNVGSPRFPVSFGEDATGNLYIVYLISGDVYRIATTAVPEPASIIQAALLLTIALSTRQTWRRIPMSR